MVANVSFNPFLTTTAVGSFGTTWDGYIQGTAMNDPSVRNYLAGGTLAAAETLPMWGGVGLFESISLNVQGSLVGRATALTGASALAGFSVFDQDHSMINTPQSPVPLAASGMGVTFYRLGSGARIPVACDAGLAALAGTATGTAVSWDFVNQQLIPFVAPDTITAGVYTQGTGLVSLTLNAATTLNPGDTFTVSAATGTGAFASINGTFTAGAGTGGNTVTYTIATGLTLTITGGSLATSGILPVKLLDVQVGNSMTVSFNAATGFATWNRAGSAALILI